MIIHVNKSFFEDVETHGQLKTIVRNLTKLKIILYNLCLFYDNSCQ